MITTAEIVLAENLAASAIRLIGFAKDALSGTPPTPQMLADEQEQTLQILTANHAQVELDKESGK